MGEEKQLENKKNNEMVLYRLQACPYCERVVRKLKDLGINYHSRFVEPLHSTRNIVKKVSGSRTVPVLIDKNTGATLSESAKIVEYLDTNYGDK